MLPKLPGLNPRYARKLSKLIGHAGCTLVIARYGCASAGRAATVAFDGARQCGSRRVNGFGELCLLPRCCSAMIRASMGGWVENRAMALGLSLIPET
jgi:hypothetical protein